MTKTITIEKKEGKTRMKAKKSLIITLFAALMVFALGATAVFAVAGTPKAKWSEDFSSVTISGCTGSDAVYNRTYTDVEKTFNTSTGAVDVTINAPDVDGIEQATLNSDGIFKTSYYDLDNAVFATASTTIKGEYAQGAYKKGSAIALQFSAPSYVTNKTDKTKVIKTLADLSAGKWQGVVKGDEEYDSASKAEQTFTLTLEVSYVDSATEINFLGKVPDKTVKVLAGQALITDVKFYKDEVPADGKGDVAAGEVTFDYDGAGHKLVTNTIDGFSVSWEVFNKTTGKFDPATECPAVTDVATPVVAKATVKDAYPTTDTRHVADVVKTFTLKAAKAGAPTIGFDPDGNGGTNTYRVEGETFDPYAFIIVNPAKGGSKEKTEANKKAAEANTAAIMEYFKDYYDIKSETSKADPNKFTLTIKAKENLTADETKALEKKYEALVANFDPAKFTAAGTGYVTINAPKITPEIEFIDSPTAMKFKAKKLKKKAASFTVKAECNTGAAVSYKLINAPAKIKIDKTTGVITLAKGLKKGTYKIKVKAFITTDYDMYAEEFHDIKIKVKK